MLSTLNIRPLDGVFVCECVIKIREIEIANKSSEYTKVDDDVVVLNICTKRWYLISTPNHLSIISTLERRKRHTHTKTH